MLMYFRNKTFAHHNAIFDLAWKFDQMQLVTGSGDNSSKLFDLGDGDFRPVSVFSGHTRSVKTVAFRKDDSNTFASGKRYLLSNSYYGTVSAIYNFRR